MTSDFTNIVQRETFKNIALMLAVYGIQVVIFKDIFRCPCRNHDSYGMTFLFIPAICVFALSLIVCRRSWTVLVTLFKYGNYETRCNYFLSSLVECFRPFLAPCSWIVLALLRGECYVCIRVGPGRQCNLEQQDINTFDFEHYYIQSFILGLACFVAMVIFATGIVCIQRCCTNTDDNLPTYDSLILAKKNAVVEAFNNKTKEMVNKYAEKLVDSTFCDHQDSKIDVDEQFIQAREKVQAICGRKLASSHIVDMPFSSMEITSSSNM
ncbi:calcium homeostasis modulator protein 6-like isoform X2 [Dendronephthya gigantea]|uniref:calcium homeostasis modulator protein 6-like isoform X2 n=1 Tax=Dendronephthya gigantea TaxID=151771 RepID=UPI00106ADC53|nr:calcium homeostasis modulator protein 6-like isoform X2 [Dendronephthya gigantea]